MVQPDLSKVDESLLPIGTQAVVTGWAGSSPSPVSSRHARHAMLTIELRSQNRFEVVTQLSPEGPLRPA